MKTDFQGSDVSKMAEEFVRNTGKGSKEEVEDAIGKIKEGMWYMVGLLQGNRQYTMMGKPEEAEGDAVRLIMRRESLYGESRGFVEEIVLEEALDKFGAERQIRKLTEEMAELQKAICKWQENEGGVEAIAEELADVRIMLDQMAMLFDVERQEMEWREMKLHRLAERLGM